MTESYVMAIDCGTQSLRAMIFDCKGKLSAMTKILYAPYTEREPGRAEQDVEVYWNSLVEAVRMLAKDHHDLLSEVHGIGITTQRDSMVCLDEEGNPLRDAIIWLDQRKASEVYEPNILMRQVYHLVGMQKTIRKLQCEGKVNWIREHEPEIWSRTAYYTQLSGFFHKRITGIWADSKASQIGHIPFDYKKQEWASPSKLSAKLYPVEPDRLLPLVEPGEVLGRTTSVFSQLTGCPEGLPVIACGSDKGCETLGMGVIDTDTGSLSFGTTATIQTTSDRYVEPLRFLPSYPAPYKGKFNPEVEIFRGFWMISWFKEQFGFEEIERSAVLGMSPEELLDTLLDQVAPGSMGLLVQPYWSPGLKKPFAKGAMIGFGSVHTKAHLYRSMIEGLCYALLSGKQKIEKVTKQKMERITVSGGASRSDGICQIAADVFGLPLYRGETTETSGLGAALIVQKGIGCYKTIDEAVEHMVRYRDAFSPDSKNHDLYCRLGSVYERIYPSLQSIYRQISEITGYPES